MERPLAASGQADVGPNVSNKKKLSRKSFENYRFLDEGDLDHPGRSAPGAMTAVPSLSEKLRFLGGPPPPANRPGGDAGHRHSLEAGFEHLRRLQDSGSRVLSC
jgi:hypothetical protein